MQLPGRKEWWKRTEEKGEAMQTSQGFALLTWATSPWATPHQPWPAPRPGRRRRGGRVRVAGRAGGRGRGGRSHVAAGSPPWRLGRWLLTSSWPAGRPEGMAERGEVRGRVVGGR